MLEWMAAVSSSVLGIVPGVEAVISLVRHRMRLQSGRQLASAFDHILRHGVAGSIDSLFDVLKVNKTSAHPVARSFGSSAPTSLSPPVIGLKIIPPNKQNKASDSGKKDFVFTCLSPRIDHGTAHHHINERTTGSSGHTGSIKEVKSTSIELDNGSQATKKI